MLLVKAVPIHTPVIGVVIQWAVIWKVVSMVVPWERAVRPARMTRTMTRALGIPIVATARRPRVCAIGAVTTTLVMLLAVIMVALLVSIVIPMISVDVIIPNQLWITTIPLTEDCRTGSLQLTFPRSPW
jgi:hypothetical protein